MAANITQRNETSMMGIIQKLGVLIDEAIGFILGLAMLVFFEAAWKTIDVIDRQRKEERK